MTRPLVDQIADAVLYEGYILYPYRASAVKNRQRFAFGGVYPKDYSDAHPGSDSWVMHTECLIVSHAKPTFTTRIRFLQLLERTSTDPDAPSWHEAIEREISVEGSGRRVMDLPARTEMDGEITRRREAILGEIEVKTDQIEDELWRIAIEMCNTTPLAGADMAWDEIMLRTCTATHAIVTVHDGEFVSLLDPPGQWRAAVEGCRQEGAWPVLVGDEGQRDTMLCSPIILYDYPQVAPESPGDFFDGTEIDEMLTLRILTMTDEEKREMSRVDERARQLLERTESLNEDELRRLHGAWRNVRDP